MSIGKKVPGASTATHVKTFKFHDDQIETVTAAIEKAKANSETDVDSAALEYVCLDYNGGQTMAQRLQAVGPNQAGKALKAAFPAEALVDFVKEFGVMELLKVIEKAARISTSLSRPSTAALARSKRASRRRSSTRVHTAADDPTGTNTKSCANWRSFFL